MPPGPKPIVIKIVIMSVKVIHQAMRIAIISLWCEQVSCLRFWMKKTYRAVKASLWNPASSLISIPRSGIGQQKRNLQRLWSHFDEWSLMSLWANDTWLVIDTVVGWGWFLVWYRGLQIRLQSECRLNRKQANGPSRRYWGTLMRRIEGDVHEGGRQRGAEISTRLSHVK